nr:hypothetical protein CFP56_03903 [Quercus suber]
MTTHERAHVGMRIATALPLFHPGRATRPETLVGKHSDRGRQMEGGLPPPCGRVTFAFRICLDRSSDAYNTHPLTHHSRSAGTKVAQQGPALRSLRLSWMSRVTTTLPCCVTGATRSRRDGEARRIMSRSSRTTLKRHHTMIHRYLYLEERATA